MSAQTKPVYTRIADELRESILSGHLFPGDSLPTEHELAGRYGTSRVTVRKALNVLCTEQLAYSHQGKGYFVKKPDYNRYSMTFNEVRSGLAVRTARMAVIEAHGDVADVLGLQEGSDVIYLRLVVLDGSEPVACIDKYLPYVKGFPTIESVTHRADYPEFVDRKLWRILLQCELRIGAGRLDPDQARLMECQDSEPVIKVSRIIKSDGGKAVGYSIACLRDGYGELSAESGYAASRPISPEARIS